jgi:choice-of-anchor A domain-containing protein
MTISRTLLLSTALSFSGMAAASATPLSAITILQDFSGIVYTNASSSSDVEGALVVGGNLTAATVYNSPNGSSQPVGFGALTVYGSTSGNSINIDNGGNAYVGGAKGATINFNGGGSYIAAPGYAITAFKTPLNALSLSLAGLAPTASNPASGNNEVFNAVPGANDIAVFNLTAAQLAAIPSFSVDLNGASTVVFNVSGASASYSANDESGTSGADGIIWNFYNATSVSLDTQIGGTVLAPDAMVSNANQIDGVLVANAWSGSGELHEYPFDGTLPSTSVPEPASCAVLGVALLGLGWVRQRNSRVKSIWSIESRTPLLTSG